MTAQTKLDDNKVNVKIKIASLWTSVMFIIIYLDYFHLYMSHTIEDIMKGRVFIFDITQGFLLAALAMVATPALMIFLSISPVGYSKSPV